MASSGGTSSGSGSSVMLQNSGSEEDLQQLMDERKKKRKISNRESARRSRIKKQKHFDDLIVQVSHLRKENSQILTKLNATTQHYLSVESENSVLRAQIAELSHRLQSLNEIISFLNLNNGGFGNYTDLEPYNVTYTADVFINNSRISSIYANQQPIMASAYMLL